jgi:anti-sigma regulatory factor (Ser/Thr protein kinase)
MSGQVMVRLRPTAAAVGLARQQLEHMRERLTDEAYEDCRLMLSELVTNSLRHASLSIDQEIELVLALQGETLRVEVGDPGPGFEPRPRAADDSAGSGWGLFLVASLADRWGVTRDGLNRVWFEVDDAADAS